MAVSKLWPVTVRLATVLDYASNPEKTTKSKSKYSDADYQALRDVVAYAKDGEKTERELFCEGIHCNPQTAREQFITVKEQFDKPDGIQAYHGYGKPSSKHGSKAVCVLFVLREPFCKAIMTLGQLILTCFLNGTLKRTPSGHRAMYRETR